MERVSAASLSAPQRPRLGCTHLSVELREGQVPCSSCSGAPAGVSGSRNVRDLLGIREAPGLLSLCHQVFLANTSVSSPQTMVAVGCGMKSL